VTSDSLENLAKIGSLKREAPAQAEIDNLVGSGRKRLKDAKNAANALESRFDLAYNAAHALALAALRRRGYRSENRYLVFQALAHTLGMDDAEWRVLATCHERRNKFEYEGVLNIDERLLAESIGVAEKMLALLQKR
jgi:hypothetical protein